MKKNRSRKPTQAQIIPLRGAQQHYGGHYFRNVMPCRSCGEAAVGWQQPTDEHERTLQEEAHRLAHHGSTEIIAANPVEAAGMLRDAARLLDLWAQRQQARDDAQEHGKAAP